MIGITTKPKGILKTLVFAVIDVGLLLVLSLAIDNDRNVNGNTTNSFRVLVSFRWVLRHTTYDTSHSSFEGVRERIFYWIFTSLSHVTNNIDVVVLFLMIETVLFLLSTEKKWQRYGFKKSIYTFLEKSYF